MKNEIQQFFKGEVDDSPETLAKYSRDASLLLVRPKLVVFPKDKEDVKSLVRWVSENKEKYPGIAITARCAGTDMSGGAIGESIIMDFTRHMNKLIKFEGNTITVEPGMFYRDFEKITLSQELILPCYTASKSLNAMGGMFGNNAAGEKTLKYGKTEDFIYEAKVVFADGHEYIVKNLSRDELIRKIGEGTFEAQIYKNIYELINKNSAEIENAKPRVSKNSAGYYIWNVAGENNFNLNKLLVGSQGTLGLATEITFKLIPNSKYSKLVAIFLNNLEPLGRLVDEILQEKPETLEAYDDKTMMLAVHFFPDFLKNRGLIGMIKFLWSFLPEFFMLLYGGFPKMILLVELAGVDNAESDKKCLALSRRIENFKLKVHITKSQMEANKYWDIRRESFSLLRKHVAQRRTAPFIDDIIVRPEFLPKFIPELNKILSKYKLTYTIAGHAGNGNFHIIPLMDFRRADTAKIIMELSESVYDLVMRYHGSITAEHNDGLIRTPFLTKMYDQEIISIFREIKKIFDPQNIFNPGKKVAVESGSGTKNYIASHIALEHDLKHRV
ncbi:MAG: FAD-binding oxidoreductase [Patescibacteria group bacterium]